MKVHTFLIFVFDSLCVGMSVEGIHQNQGDVTLVSLVHVLCVCVCVCECGEGGGDRWVGKRLGREVKEIHTMSSRVMVHAGGSRHVPLDITTT